MVESQPKTKLETYKDILTLIKNLVEVIAIIVAGIWAYSKYIETDKPLFEPRASSKSDFEWYQIPQSESCLARFGVTIKNIGRHPFKMNQATIRAWLIEWPDPDQK